MRPIVMTALALAAVASIAGDAHAIPAWARKYNMNCSGCHYPAVPRLNFQGLQFKWAGYRMPDEIGEKQEVTKIEEYFAARTGVQYNYLKTQSAPVTTNAIAAPTGSVFVAGALGKFYGGFLEFERGAEGVDLVVQVLRIWGNKDNWGGVHVGQGHLLADGAVAGFDRPVGINDPLPLGSPTTAAVPFMFMNDQGGAEAFYVFRGRDRLAVQWINGTTAAMEGVEASPSTKHDWGVSNQFMWDDAGSGLYTAAYYGTIAGLDPDSPDVNSHYYRLAASANKIISNVELLGGYVYSKDLDLPVTATSPFTSATARGNGYWVSGQYVFPKTSLTLFTRYEFVDPDNGVDDDAIRRIVAGSVLPVNLPEYLRLGLEYFRDVPQFSGAPRTNGITAEVMLAF